MIRLPAPRSISNRAPGVRPDTTTNPTERLTLNPPRGDAQRSALRRRYGYTSPKRRNGVSASSVGMQHRHHHHLGPYRPSQRWVVIGGCAISLDASSIRFSPTPIQSALSRSRSRDIVHNRSTCPWYQFSSASDMICYQWGADRVCYQVISNKSTRALVVMRVDQPIWQIGADTRHALSTIHRVSVLRPGSC